MSDDELIAARAMAHSVIEAMVDDPAEIVEGMVGSDVLSDLLAPIQSERDLLLAHSCWHATCAMEKGAEAVAVLGAAHLKGVEQHFGEFGCTAGCDSHRCGFKDRTVELMSKPRDKLCLLYTSPSPRDS
eukprot:TRINITY_DN13442_c0_g1_i3.p1 TRINITY_DN13442_c0_g1~~TRINITY_DN13442_c0_g1_i3.p1  ORF type:complete len:129 (+),score=33.31 TRINITY_DN13442_c0_g1_i3:127-513(+)